MKKKYISILLIMMLAITSTVTMAFAEAPEEQTTPAEGQTNEESVVPEGTNDEDAVVQNNEDGVQNEVTQPEDQEESEEPEAEGAKMHTFTTDSTQIVAKAERKDGTTNVVVTWENKPEGFTVTSVSGFKDGSDVAFETKQVASTDTSCTFDSLGKGKYRFTVTATEDADPHRTETSELSNEIDISDAPVAPTIETFSAYKRVVVEVAKPASGITYALYVDGVLSNVAPVTSDYNGNVLAYHVKFKDVDDHVDLATHKFQIAATDTYGRTAKSAEVSDAAFRPMYIDITFRQTKKLKSHGGKKASRKFKKGQTVKAFMFVKGQYRFYDKGSLFHVNYSRIGKAKALYNGKGQWNYSAKEAEYFVNTAGEKSMTKQLILANLYTQHLWLMTGSKGKWRVTTIKYKGKNYRDWEVASGKAKTPTPGGLTLKYKGKKVNIYKKSGVVYGHKTKNWNFYHSQTALHGKVGNKGYGVPRSLGCIRNTDAQAIFIKNKIKMKTRVVVY